jgi:putative acetyltransferase
MITVKRTDSGDRDFVNLVMQLDAELAVRDGPDHSFYAQFNTIDRIKFVVVAYHETTPVGCGAIKEYGPGIMEIKRMFVLPAWRQQGVATSVLTDLEDWARELSARRCILETGKKQPEAIRLYSRLGYRVIPNYGQYAGVVNSVCFEKAIR